MRAETKRQNAAGESKRQANSQTDKHLTPVRWSGGGWALTQTAKLKNVLPRRQGQSIHVSAK